MRPSATKTRRAPDCRTRRQTARTVSEGSEGATEVPQATKPQREETTVFESPNNHGANPTLPLESPRSRSRKVRLVVKFYAKSSIKIQKLIENLIIENFQSMYFFYLKVAVWILPEARVQTAGTPQRACSVGRQLCLRPRKALQKPKYRLPSDALTVFGDHTLSGDADGGGYT
jgi:hypothetical protein